MTLITLEPNYKPSAKEEYMCEKQLEYFRQKLLTWRADLVKESNFTLQDLKETNLNEPDLNDRASSEADQSLELRTRDRMRKLIKKINPALHSIENGTYGYCEETGEPIGLGRLEARPVATLCIEAQERHERKEKTQADE
ncbi:MAG: RNA polymerase-binding protein DksA [Alphaproteobacteria bacterium]